MTAPAPRPGSVALVTGGTGGFGRALAAKLGERGVTVVLADLDSGRARAAAAGLTVLVPPDDDAGRVDAAIFGELCRGVLSDATRAELRAVAARLADRGAQSVALCCTELELLLGPEDAPVPLLPSARLHVTAAVDAALAPSAVVV